ncbi:MAG: NAD(P) transhydrogenase subunit alpha [Clostridiaceae bacterium]|jgi:NAD(P) transhydrogenase subunit alpha|nr:NAD(P) transhydrogenase subunit alpha [Clostridiaceae bacterium]
MHPALIIGLFIVFALIGYRLIGQVPTLLHTPLMSGMNALSGLAVLGALGTAAAAAGTGSRWLGYLAIILAMINVAGGFGVTERMLRFFRSKKAKAGDSHD